MQKVPESFLNEEKRELVVSVRRKRQWAELMDLMMEFDRVCVKCGIRYFIDGGTLLGAIRHGGFIPWDDDMDVVLRRDEYNRLINEGRLEFKDPYFLQCFQTEPECGRMFARLRNSSTTAIQEFETRRGVPIYAHNQGLFIDIFPFDGVPDDLAERKLFIAEIKKGRRKVKRLRSFMYARKPGFWHWVQRVTVRAFLRFAGLDPLPAAMRHLDDVIRRYEHVDTAEMAPLAFREAHKEILPRHFFDDVVHVDFEFLKLPAMKMYEKALEINYGNWHEHVIGAAQHDKIFLDLSRSYLDYLGRPVF